VREMKFPVLSVVILLSAVVFTESNGDEMLPPPFNSRLEDLPSSSSTTIEGVDRHHGVDQRSSLSSSLHDDLLSIDSQYPADASTPAKGGPSGIIVSHHSRETLLISIDHYVHDTAGRDVLWEKFKQVLDEEREQLMKVVDQLSAQVDDITSEKNREIASLKLSLDKYETLRLNVTGDMLSDVSVDAVEGGGGDVDGMDDDHRVRVTHDEHAPMSNGEREGTRLVATVPSDKAILQGVAQYVGNTAGTPEWSTTSGDPCADEWYGVTCDASGYITRIYLGGKALSGDIFSPSLTCLIIHIHPLHTYL
jgi:hypothetical protein